MKKAILLISGFLISCSVFAQKGQQTVGLQVGANVTTENLLDGIPYTKPVFSNIGGVFYNWDFSRRFGIGVGAYYRSKTQRGRNFSLIPENYTLYKFSLSYLEVPVNLVLDLNRRETAKWKTYFTFGYTYSRLLNTRQTVLDSVRFGSFPQILIGKKKDFHYITAGFEIRHNFKGKYMFALCPNFRFPANETVDQGQLGLSFKLGRIL